MKCVHGEACERSLPNLIFNTVAFIGMLAWALWTWRAGWAAYASFAAYANIDVLMTHHLGSKSKA